MGCEECTQSSGLTSIISHTLLVLYRCAMWWSYAEALTKLGALYCLFLRAYSVPGMLLSRFHTGTYNDEEDPPPQTKCDSVLSQ